LGLTYTGEELMYHYEDLFSQEDEALTNIETAVAGVSAFFFFFFFLLCFNIYYFCLRPEQDDDEAEAQYYAEKAMFEKTAVIKRKGEEETELGSAGFNPIQVPKKVRALPCLTTMLSSKGSKAGGSTAAAPPPPPPPPPLRSTVGPQDVLSGNRFEIESRRNHVQNADFKCDTPRFLSGYDLLGTFLKDGPGAPVPGFFTYFCVYTY
jgi:hypothetical protein